MTWKEIVYPSPNLQELYRLALSICAATILLGGWGDINYHPALLAVLPALFIYQFSSYFTANESISLRWRQRLAVVMELIDGVITGLLLAFVGFDPMVMLGLGLIFLVTIVGCLKPTSPLDLLGVFIGAALTAWLLPISITPSSGIQLFILIIGAGYALLQANLARHTHCLLAVQHDRVLRQNEWLTLRTFRLSKYLSPALRKAILSGKDVRAETQEKTLTIFFSDMEGFTKLAEELDAEQLTELLNTYLTEMSEIAFRFGGTIDKVIGDSIMVFFGDPESRGIQSDAVTCVSMAIAMKRAMKGLQVAGALMVLKIHRHCVWVLIAVSVRWVILVLKTVLITHCLGVQSIWLADLNHRPRAMRFLFPRIPTIWLRARCTALIKVKSQSRALPGQSMFIVLLICIKI